jgi:hypothetical protein
MGVVGNLTGQSRGKNEQEMKVLVQHYCGRIAPEVEKSIKYQPSEEMPPPKRAQIKT